MIQAQTRGRVDSQARWLKAAERAVAEGIQVRQLQGSGQWIANSGHDCSVAYEVQSTSAAAPTRRSDDTKPGVELKAMKPQSQKGHSGHH